MIETTFVITQIVLFIFGIICFIALYFIPAGYGKLIDKKWGYSVPNNIAWIIMELPAPLTMILLMVINPERVSVVRIIISSLFIAHYLQRTFIFPFLIKGKSKMPLSIISLGMFFNTINSLLIGGWLFYFSPKDAYQISYLYDPRFILGFIIFVVGMGINIYSDTHIRSLRKNGDTAHYFPHKGMYKYVTSANYFGEILEWVGYAILSWSIPSALFAFWTMANLVPRADTINKKYKADFPEQMQELKPKRVFPYVY